MLDRGSLEFVFLVVDDHSAPRVAIFLDDVGQFFEHDLELQLLRTEQLLQIFDRRLQLRDAIHQLRLLQGSQPRESHVQDGVSLHVAQPETILELQRRRPPVLRGANDLDHLFDVLERRQ